MLIQVGHLRPWVSPSLVINKPLTVIPAKYIDPNNPILYASAPNHDYKSISYIQVQACRPSYLGKVMSPSQFEC